MYYRHVYYYMEVEYQHFGSSLMMKFSRQLGLWGPGAEKSRVFRLQMGCPGSRTGASDHRCTLEQGTKLCLCLDAAQTGSSNKRLTLINENGNEENLLLVTPSPFYLLINDINLFFLYNSSFSFRLELQLWICEP